MHALGWKLAALLAVCMAFLPTPVHSFLPYLPQGPNDTLGNFPCPKQIVHTLTSEIPTTSTRLIITTKAVLDRTTLLRVTTETKVKVTTTREVVATTETVPIRNPLVTTHLLTVKTDSTEYLGGQILSTVKPILLEPTVTILNPKEVVVGSTLIKESYSEKAYTADVTALSSSIKTETCTVASTIVKANEVTTTLLTATKYVFVERTVEPEPAATTLTSTKYNVRIKTQMLPALTQYTTITPVDPLKLTIREELHDTTTREEKPMPLSTILQQTCIYDQKNKIITDFVPTVKFQKDTVTKFATRTLIRSTPVVLTETSIKLQSVKTETREVYLNNDVVVMTVGKPFTIISAPTIVLKEIQNLISYTLVDKVSVESTTVNIPCIKEYNYQELENPIRY